MIRFRSVEIENFKNVEHGRVVLSDAESIDDLGDGAEVVGLYGQNGSGKTSFIEALSILRALMRGESLSRNACEYVRNGQEAMRIKAEFFCVAGDDDLICDYVNGITEEPPSHAPYLAIYEVLIGSHLQRGPLVLAESLSCKDLEVAENMHGVFSWSLVTDAPANEAERRDSANRPSEIPRWLEEAGGDWSYDIGTISPATRWQSLLAVDRQLTSKFEAARNQAFERGASAIFSTGLIVFSRDMLAVSSRKISKTAAGALRRVLLPAFQVAASCRKFATVDMVVLPTAHQGVLPLGYLPLASHEGSRGEYVDNFMWLDIEKPNPVSVKIVGELERALDNVSEVIGELVPGLSVEVERRGSIVGSDGQPLENIELMSVRGQSRVPLRYESEGIKKVLSIVSLLIDVHTNPATFVAIDEFDSGVFEYLLGEILQTIADHGCGQLVFTAHNLRPLEVLGSGSIWFTTVCPDRRYRKAVGVHGSNNLRRMYLRDIRLGNDGDDVYVPTSPLRIDSALYNAGAVVKSMRKAQGS